MVELGEIYMEGHYVMRDVEHAKSWFCKAQAYGAARYEDLYGLDLTCD